MQPEEKSWLNVSPVKAFSLAIRQPTSSSFGHWDFQQLMYHLATCMDESICQPVESVVFISQVSARDLARSWQTRPYPGMLSCKNLEEPIVFGAGSTRLADRSDGSGQQFEIAIWQIYSLCNGRWHDAYPQRNYCRCCLIQRDARAWMATLFPKLLLHTLLQEVHMILKQDRRRQAASANS